MLTMDEVIEQRIPLIRKHLTEFITANLFETYETFESNSEDMLANLVKLNIIHSGKLVSCSQTQVTFNIGFKEGDNTYDINWEWDLIPNDNGDVEAYDRAMKFI